jgi:hypothetical protein
VFCVPADSKEDWMPRIVRVAGVAAVLMLAVASGFGQSSKGKDDGNIVIVFKDGHRQSFHLADIARVEFPGASSAATDARGTPPGAPPRGHFFGKWEVGDGAGNDFFITLKESGEAFRSLRSMHGKWAYINGEARITWDDGAQDVIRRVDGRDKKAAYGAGKSFTDEPDNVTDARNTSPRPI